MAGCSFYVKRYLVDFVTDCRFDILLLISSTAILLIKYSAYRFYGIKNWIIVR